MTFSIVGRSRDGSALGVAVASRFLAAGAYVPAAAVGAGAVATQAYGNLALRTEGLALLRGKASAAELVELFFRDDPKREERQAGVVDARGGAATFTDVVVDLRSDDAPEPIAELQRMLDLHDLYFGTTPDEDLLPLDEPLASELRVRLASAGYGSGNLSRDLYDWMGRENFEERWSDGKVDPVVLQHLRATS